MRARRAFTLPELLVVLGVIALLVGILLPVLHNAREQARQAQCTGNVRNILHAIAAYATAYEGGLPAAPGPDDDWATHPDPRLAFFFTSHRSGQIEFVHGAIMEYIGSIDQRPVIMRCPDAAAIANYSYSFNKELKLDQTSRLPNVVRPSDKIMVFEEDYETVNPSARDGRFDITDPNETPSTHHLNHTAGNYGFADGHVETLTWAYLKYKPNWWRADLFK